MGEVFGKILQFFVGIVLIFSAFLKFIQIDYVVTAFSNWGLSDYINVIATIELISAFLFLIPATFGIGVLLLNAFMGGAIATHLVAEEIELIWIPIIFLILIWISAYNKNKNIFDSV